MYFSNLLHFILLLVPLFLPVSGFSEYYTFACDNQSSSTSDGNYTAKSTYLSNVNRLFSVLQSNSTATGFAAGTVGTAPDQVSGLLLCRGDINASYCSACLSQTFKDILNMCPYYKTAVMWYNSCYVYYSNRNFLSSFDNAPQKSLDSGGFVSSSSMAGFERIINPLLSTMTIYAVDHSTNNFATGIMTNVGTNYPTIYGLLQCIPEMTTSQCQGCLQDLTNGMSGLTGATGARVVAIYCNFRYEYDPFYEGAALIKLDGSARATSPAPIMDPTVTPAASARAASPAPIMDPTVTPAANKGNTKKKNTTGTVLAITITVSLAGLLSIALACICLCKKNRLNGRIKLTSWDIENVDDSLLIGLSTLKAGTANFHDSNKLGEGGFGAVYKGVLRNGQEVAVKRLSQSSSQGLQELKNELVLVAKLQHKNLVRVLGVCLEEEERLLVYEFVPNKSLDTVLFDQEKRAELDWEKRYRIINGVARGLQYLHEDSQLKIIHRDLKASNILLDLDMIPKISDFGLARLFRVDQTADVTRRVVGTYGYMAPEYAMHGIFSVKSDVFSFGVLLLEIITGRRNGGSFDGDQAEDLLSSTWDQWTTGTINGIADPLLECSRSELMRHIHIGLLCVQEDLTIRPLMSEVVIMLDSNTISLQAPSKPAFYFSRSGHSYSTHVSNDRFRGATNDVTLSELDPR